MSERKLALPTKTYSLSSIGDAWKDCYVAYRPLTPRDLLDVADLDVNDLQGLDASKYIVRLVREHVAGGKIALESGVVDMEPTDVELLPVEVLTELFAEMSGGSLDPKGSGTAQTASNAPTNS